MENKDNRIQTTVYLTPENNMIVAGRRLNLQEIGKDVSRSEMINRLISICDQDDAVDMGCQSEERRS